LVAYRHGLRASELVALRWDDIDLATALACTQGQERGCQRASDIGAGKPRAAQAPARSPTVPIRLHLGAWCAVVRSGISAHGCQGGRGREIHLPRALPHAAACLRVQARQRRPRHAQSKPISATDRSCPRSATRP
jgi:integrase